MKKLLLTAALGLSLLASFTMPVLVLAQDLPPSQTSGLPPSQTSGAAPPSTAPVNSAPAGQYSVTNPLGNINSVCGLIKAILGAAIQIGVPIAVLFIVYAGFQFVLARGNSEALTSARQNMLYTCIGIAIFLGAWLLANLIANTVNGLQAGSGQANIISCN